MQVDLEAAVAIYEEAADYAEMDSSAESTKAKAQIKVATLAGQLEDYEKSIRLFEEIANALVFTPPTAFCQLGSTTAAFACCSPPPTTLRRVRLSYFFPPRMSEMLNRRYVEKELLKFSCKEFYLKAGLCTLASGDVEGSKVIQKRAQGSAALRFAGVEGDEFCFALGWRVFSLGRYV